MQARRAGEVTLGLVLLALTAFLAWQTLRFPGPPPGIPVGPATYPRGILAFIALMSVVMIVQSLRRPTAEPISFRGWQYAVGAALAFALYVKLAGVVGYFAITTAYMVAMLYILHVRNWLVIAGTTVVYLAFVYVFFVHILGLPLPAGILG